MCNSLDTGKELLEQISQLNDEILSPLEEKIQRYREERIPHSLITLSLSGQFTSDRLPERFISRFRLSREDLLSKFFWELAIPHEQDRVRLCFLERNHCKVFEVEFDCYGAHGGLVSTHWIVEPSSPDLNGLTCLVTCEVHTEQLCELPNTPGVHIHSVFNAPGIMIGVISVYEVDGIYPFLVERTCTDGRISISGQYGIAKVGVYPDNVHDSAIEYDVAQDKRVIIKRGQKHYLRFNQPTCLTIRIEGDNPASIQHYTAYDLQPRRT